VRDHRITVTVFVPVESAGWLAVVMTWIFLLTRWSAIVTWLSVPALAEPERVSPDARGHFSY
jgi:hypothetical protein